MKKRILTAFLYAACASLPIGMALQAALTAATDIIPESVVFRSAAMGVLGAFGPNLFLLLGAQVPTTQTPADSAAPPRSVRYRQLTTPSRPTEDEIRFGRDAANLPRGYRSNYDVDSVGGSVYSQRSIDSFRLGYGYSIDLDTYLGKRRAQIQNGIWDSLLTSYDMKKALSRGDLSRMVAQATGFSIPIPPNPISSIFGKPEISINVNGEVNLRVGWRWDSQNLGTVSAYGQTQSSPIFNQDIKLDISAKIGDKLKLGTNWNTRQAFDYDNQFKLGYEGYDDDIIKRVEFGNVNFPIPSTLIGGGQALFGVRSDYQFGPLYLKTVFSQRRGQRKFVDVRGGSNRQPFQVRAYDYSRNHFFLDTGYKQIYDDYFKNGTPIIPNTPRAREMAIKQIEVWEATTDVAEQAIRSARSVAIADLPGKRRRLGENWTFAEKAQPTQSGLVERGNFIRLDTNSYRVDMNLGTLTLYSMRQDRYYAVSYRTEGATPDSADDVYYGTFANQVGELDTLLLKLVYRPNIQPAWKSIWSRQMKNIYSINATNVSTTDTRISLWYIRQSNDSADVLEGAPDKLVTIFGVDRMNVSAGTATPDGVFDLRPPFFDAQRGEITFPSAEPFGDGLRRYFSRLGNPELAELYTFDQVYDTTYDIAARNTARDRFVISGEVTGRATNNISLGAFNLAPNSVRVSLDGVTLRENDDYRVNYYSGTLTILNPRASLPNANLRVEYEQQDMFNVSTKTLAGLRADYTLIKARTANMGLGFTFMHYDQSATIDRVRLGDEPVSNTMFGFDTKLNWETPWMTRALDLLPFYETKAPSSMSLGGEWAMMLPLPNKRRSEIASDNSEPVVFIDDFEGAQRYVPLGINTSLWTHSAPPVAPDIDSTGSGVNNYRGRLYWWQFFNPRVPIKEVYPKNESFQQGRMNLGPLYVNFDPDYRGIYNRNPEYTDPLSKQYYDSLNPYASRPEIRKKTWAGFQRLLSSFYTNFDADNIEYIEITMSVGNREGSTKMFIDLGQISEDIIPNGSLNTEDGITDKVRIPNGIIDVGEDVGIDSLSDANEKIMYPFPLNQEDDPSRDNYYFDFNKDDRERGPSDFLRYNNYEGNSTQSELGQFPDTEIMNSTNGQSLSLDNSYFTYEVNLEPNPDLNSQIVGGNPEAGWLVYRIPVRKPTSFVGAPLFSNIQYARVRFQGGRFEARIVDWKLVGSQWQRISNLQNVPANDSTLQLSFVNLWENSGEPEFYSMPPGVRAPRELNNPDPTQDIRKNEQSLAVSVRNLKFGEERMTTRIFHPLDIFFYKKLKFFIHGDGAMPDNSLPGATPKAYAYMRFGTDSLNYYEYRRPLVRGWQDIEINLTELTEVKQRRDSTMQYDRQTFPLRNDPLATFSIRGNPVLTRVQFFGVGISNPAERFPNELTTTMWVDELRLISPEDASDWAAVGNFDMKLADLGSISASIQNSMPNFHKLEERFGRRIGSVNWAVSMQGNLEKFAPKSFNGMRIPISYSHSELAEEPEFVANNDVNLDRAVAVAKQNAYAQAKSGGLSESEAQALASSAERATRSRSQSLRVQDSWALTGVKLGLPTNEWYIRETVNRLTVGYSYSQEMERSPVYTQRFNWQWRLGAQYNVQVPPIAAFAPLKWADSLPGLGYFSKWKINLLPTSFSTGVDLARRRQTEQSRFLDFPSPVVRDFSANRTAQMAWKLTEGGLLNPLVDYSVTTISTLVPFELEPNGRQRTGSELASQILFKDGAIFDFGKNSQHTQNVTINFKPRLPIGVAAEYLDMTGSFNTVYSWSDPLQPDPAIRDIAKNASYNNQIRYNTVFKIKQLGDKLYGARKTALGPKADSARASMNSDFDNIIRGLFFDWENMNLTFSQTSSSNNPGVYGGNGMNNFWGRGLLFQNSRAIYGPSFAYQLGLIDDPHGTIGVVPSSTFPYIGFRTKMGKRPPNAVLQDNFRQQTGLELRTSRPLWEGATLDVNWKTDLGFNRNQTINTDEFGNVRISNKNATESFSRTFLTFPTIFGFNPLSNTVEHVVELYNQRKQVILNSNADTITKNQRLQEALSKSFYEGLEAFSITGGRAGKFLPAINWAIRWEGLEKFSFWKSIVKRASLEHAYISTYQESVLITDNGRGIQSQIVQYGFSPLIGVTAGFDEKKLDGTLTASFRWNSTKSYQVNSVMRSAISSQSTNEITGTASYVMRGFEFPFFGINLKNDFEMSFLATYKDNAQASYNILDPTSYEGTQNAGMPLTGNTQIILEPRARYSISDKVTASAYFRYEGTFSEGAANSGYHTTQVGLDLRINVSGGR
ncbi:MAG: cell surface protein SprA [Chloroflexota bacterium]